MDMGFIPLKAQCDIWMHEKDRTYEYIGVYIDDLIIVSWDPESIMNTLIKVHDLSSRAWDQLLSIWDVTCQASYLSFCQFLWPLNSLEGLS
jgi:hypothetical protein